jgi:hypothetical protein
VFGNSSANWRQLKGSFGHIFGGLDLVANVAQDFHAEKKENRGYPLVMTNSLPWKITIFNR